MNATLVILAIGFVVWLASTIYKNAEDAKKRQELERPRAPRAGAAADIDRFLEEIQRRRQQQTAAARPAPERPRPIPAALIEKPPARPQPRPPAPVRPLAARPAAVAQARPVPARPLEAPRPTRAPAPPAFLVEEPLVLITPPPSYEAYALAPAGEEKVRRIQGETKNPAPHAADLIRMLHSHKGIKQAILVGMVLGQPRCRQAPGQRII